MIAAFVSNAFTSINVLRRDISKHLLDFLRLLKIGCMPCHRFEKLQDVISYVIWKVMAFFQERLCCMCNCSNFLCFRGFSSFACICMEYLTITVHTLLVIATVGAVMSVASTIRRSLFSSSVTNAFTSIAGAFISKWFQIETTIPTWALMLLRSKYRQGRLPTEMKCAGTVVLAKIHDESVLHLLCSTSERSRKDYSWMRKVNELCVPRSWWYQKLGFCSGCNKINVCLEFWHSFKALEIFAGF